MANFQTEKCKETSIECAAYSLFDDKVKSRKLYGSKEGIRTFSFTYRRTTWQTNLLTGDSNSFFYFQYEGWRQQVVSDMLKDPLTVAEICKQYEI